MTTLRSSWPSRLRQLLSSGGAIGPSVKVDSEPPPKIKAFIEKIIQCPLQDIAIPLSGFRWEYNKGNFHHWRPLLLHFDTYFKTYLSCRNDLTLLDNLEDDSPLPKHAILQILRVMQKILENCPNKSSFDGLEHFKLLLASTDPEILVATLETLSALVKINPSKLHGSPKMICCGSVNSYLLSLAQGWGSKEEGLGLYSCVMANEKAQDEALCLFPSEEIGHDQSNCRIGTTLYFELHGPNAQSKEHSADAVSPSSTVIHMPDLHLRKEDDLSLMKQCTEEFSIPSELRFSLLTRIRYARAFRSPRICRLYSRICLLSFIVLVQSGDAQEELVSFFANEPEYTNELIRIVRSEEVISGSIRTLAMLALGAQLAAYTSSHHRARISGSSLTFAGGNRMILLNVLQRAILSLKISNDPSSLAFVEALLQFYLLHVVSTSTSGNNIRGSGMVPTFLPLLEDFDPTHIHLVCFAVKTLQKLMDYSSSAVSLFKELGGIELLAQRLQKEVHRVIGLVGGTDNMMLTGESLGHSTDQLYSQKRLIKVSLKALGSATYAPANSTRSQHSQDSSLPITLSLIFKNVDKFGGDIYYSAVTVMSEIIHKDPTFFSALHEIGLPDAFLLSVGSGILPSSKALTCIPNGLGAICLNAKGLEAVRESSSLRFLVDIFTSKKYVLAMNEAIVPLANAVEELLRHVSTLRSTGVDIIIEIIHKITSFGDGNGAGFSGKAEGTAMETDSENKEKEGHCCIVGTSYSAVEGISDEQFIQLCVFHLMVLVHRTMENAETCRLFVEKSGIEALLNLLLRPTIAQSSDGMSIALHSTMVFKGFAQHHSIPLAHAFCSSLREHLKKTLVGFGAASEPLLLDPRMTTDGGIFSSLFLVEFLLFLVASKDNRWVTALLTEFGNESKDVLEDIGCVHREVLWQISLLENRKPEIEEDGACSSDSQQAEGDVSETEEQRFNSFRQYLDPLLRRRTSGWSIESQFFNLINLYRDLGRSTGSQNRLVGPRSSSSNQVQHSGSDDNWGTANKKESDKQRAYYTSCCDMVRSLSFHITHLFQELGKVMLLPSRRRDDVVNVSPASKSVASTFASIAFDHMNYGGRCVNLSGTEESISTKCRYFGKVIDFMDNVLMERPDSCNPIMLNCLYGHGVIEIVLTTFEATSQLLFTVNRAPASPMDTDDANAKQDDKEDTDNSWIYGSLASYGKLMDHLVTSSFILSSFTKHLLAQPLTNGDTPFPRDAETFVKVLQSRVLKTVLPVWTHPKFVDCSYEFISTVISIIRHVYTGVEVKNVNGSAGARITGPPPNETTISTIVEMGFSRSRAEEALRQVGSNSVELAMEWLFSHPEEAQEDDELARALAMSLGNSESDSKDAVANDNALQLEEEMVQLPPVDELLSTCTKLLSKEPLAFPVRDLLVMICSQDDGQHRSNVVSFIVERIKECGLVPSNGNYAMLAALFHVLALILNEDAVAREAASTSGLIKIASDLLYQWDSSLDIKEKHQVPKWVTAAFLALDRLLQVDQKLNSEIAEQLKKEAVNSQQTSITIDEDRQNKMQSALGLSMKYADIHEQKRLVEVACSCMKNQLPSDTMHAVLLLCSNLTRNHSVALTFLDSGGLSLLLSLPTSSLFPGFDNVAASIVRHVLEDPQTLHQAMESEIKHSLVVASNRHPNGRVNPHNFLLNLASVISRDPVIFMQAAQSVCQVEMVGERPYIVLLKDRDKDKAKDKEKDKDKTLEKDKVQNIDGKVVLGNTNTAPTGNGHGKIQDSNTKSAKGHRKPTQSFINAIELLLESVCTFVPPLKGDIASNVLPGTPASTDMDIDASMVKGKGKAVATDSEGNETGSQDASASLAKIVFILKLLTEILLMYSSSVHVLLRRDAEMSSIRGSYQKSPAGLSMGGIFSHILHNFLPYSRNSKKDKKADGDWRQKLATRANQFMVGACVRSTEARKRVFGEICCIINEFVDSCHGIKRPGKEIQVFVDLLNDVLAARTPAGSSISAEASTTFIDAGLVKSFTCTLQVLDLDHADSSEVATGIIKALELVTKEHVQLVDSSAGKGDNSAKPSVLSQPGRTNNIGDMSQSMETSQANPDSLQVDRVGSYAVCSYGGSEAVTDDMEHDQDLDGSFAPANEDDYMHENSEDARDLENGMENVGLQFEIQSHGQENLDEDDDEDDDMSEDEGEDVDEDEDDDEEHNDLEEVHHLPHPDTDQDEHEIDDEDFDDEVMEEEDEDDEEDEDGVILQLEEGINGINVFDHIEVFGRDNSFANEAFQVMPVEVFGSRRQGRTTSIYSLLGRTGDTAVPSRHPLLLEPSSFPPPTGQSGQFLRIVYSSLENNSLGLDNIFRSLRSGRHGQRLHLWTDNNQQSGGTNTVVVPQGLEDLLVTQLRRPIPEKSSNQNIAEAGSHGKVGTTQAQDAGGARPEVPVESNAVLEVSTITPSVDNSNNAGVRPAGTGPSHTNVSNTHSQEVEMQFEHADGAVRDVEAVSQESSGSGATFGESLRSLDVEIGSADGHDDGGERQVSADRVAGDSQAARTRRANTPLSHISPVVGRDAFLHSVTEVSENSSRDADQDGAAAEQQVNSDAGSGAIDPAFLDALPEELRAELLSAQQGQVAQPSNAESQNTGDIDPEFLAALPADIRAEILAQQQAQRLHQSQELEGQPVEMDTVLLTSPDTILANLTPALVAEANMLRERFAHRYSRTLFGMYPRSRRGETSRREGIGSGLDGAGGTISSRRSNGVKVVEADGAPLVDTEALHAMIRLLRVVQPLYKGQLQRLLLNLCAHSETRTSLVKILMDLLMLDVKRPVSYFSKVEPPYRLYGCQSNVMYSRPQSFDGVPPLLSRRILETLTYLARNHLYVAKILLQCWLPNPAIKEPDDARGKAVMVVEDEVNIGESNDGYIAIAMLLGLLNQPLYLRSIAHLEQLLNLLDVIIDSAGNKSSDKSLISTNPSSAPQISAVEANANADSNILSSVDDASKVDGSSKPTPSGINVECESHGVLSNLSNAELRLLCSLLAQEGLSDNAYNLVAEVMKKLVAIAPTHCELFVTELAEAVQKLTSSAMNELRVFSEAMKALLSTSSTDGAAILRVLQALSSLVTLLTEKENDRGTPALSEVWEINSALEPLWHELSCCISKIESYSESASEISTSSSTFVSKPSGVMPPLPAGSQNILPYIESFFVVCEKLHPAQPGDSHDSSIPVISDVEYATTSATPQKASGTAVKVDEKHMPFVRFSEKHRKLLNAFLRQNPGLLEKSFSLMLKVPRFIDFDNKRAHFRSKIKHQHDHHHSPLRISVRRAYVLEDSYNQLRLRSTQDLKGRLTVHFQGEEGIDAGGLTREWYQLLSRVIFDKGALLFTTVGNESTFQPNPNSVYQTEHLSYFKFVGRVVGKALFDGQLLDVHFTRSFYKHILGVKNDISDVLDLTFSIDADEEKLILYERTEVTDYELIPGGRNIKVTEENKHQYVDLVAEHRLTTAIRPQINSFLEGFNEMIPRELISIFNDKELELLISGLPDIDLDDLRANTEYSGYSAASPVIQWFWEVVQGLSKEDKARLLQFVTGTSKVPLEGFSALQGISGSQKFQIHKAYGSPDHLPSAHTCFNQLDLPEYPSKHHLEERLLLAIHEASEGFGFG
ncbi:E3 ubiquitin-protein ligase UPL2 [Glycine soja]